MEEKQFEDFGRLTHMQESFCNEYVIDWHGTNAAIRAGATPKSAHVTASKWLKMAKIKERITQLQAENSKISGLHRKRLIQSLAEIAFFDPAEMYDKDTGQLLHVNKMPAHIRRVVAAVEEIELPGGVGLLKKVKTVPKEKAQEMLMRHLGLYEKDNDQKRHNLIIVDFNDDDENNTGENGAETMDTDTDPDELFTD